MTPEDEAPAGAATRVRIDKWLWAARFYRTRTLACDAIESGQVRVDGERVKPSRGVKAGDRVTVRKGGIAWEVEVAALAERRGSATEAARLYREDAASVAAREQEVARRKAAAPSRVPGRPTKRDRRALDDFLNEP
ncbi:MAG: RNA-binding S4 domain-containing protein [Betaproteobacteria bacterium]|jgi:ribosome-associated heat shock protein Hsp15|nr:RNA-binding S4 domain-containing protein [Betaproteobacteria bacterium]